MVNFVTAFPQTLIVSSSEESIGKPEPSITAYIAPPGLEELGVKLFMVNGTVDGEIPELSA